ncbi:hypothetical protein F4861DRAFT_536431 [Xylaria intraflava]|nr:hypothetical protein F4861DRAFT_536431 [Xylaria intraflava]
MEVQDPGHGHNVSTSYPEPSQHSQDTTALEKESSEHSQVSQHSQDNSMPNQEGSQHGQASQHSQDITAQTLKQKTSRKDQDIAMLDRERSQDGQVSQHTQESSVLNEEPSQMGQDFAVPDQKPSQHNNDASHHSQLVSQHPNLIVSHGFEIVQRKPDGSVSYLDVKILAEYLDTVSDKAQVVKTIVADICALREYSEPFKVWVSQVHDLVFEKGRWKGKCTTMEACGRANPKFFTFARLGGKIRAKKKLDVDALVSKGFSGPRFEYMIAHSPASLVNAVRRQAEKHGLVYPFICAWSNIRTCRRLQTMHQTVAVHRTEAGDIADLNKVTYQELSVDFLDSLDVEVGGHGFLQEKGTSEGQSVVDDAFDRAMASFMGQASSSNKDGVRGIQPNVQPNTPSKQVDEGNTIPTKRIKLSEGPTPIDIQRFNYIADCNCAQEVPAYIKSGLEHMAVHCSYANFEKVLPDLLQYCDKFCARHCQLTLVKVLGRDRLVHETDTLSLQAEIRGLVPKLRHCFRNKTLRGKFDSYKKSIGFSWDIIETASVYHNRKY